MDTKIASQCGLAAMLLRGLEAIGSSVGAVRHPSAHANRVLVERDELVAELHGNTRALEALDPDDLERLSPPVHRHIHLDGRYSFTLPEPLTREQLQPLRDPNDPAKQVFDLSSATAYHHIA